MKQNVTIVRTERKSKVDEMSSLKYLNDENFSVAVENSQLPVLVDFSATWCSPCKALSPVIEKLANELEGRAFVYKIDIDEAPEVTNKYGIRSVPTVIVFRDGKVAGTTVGVKTREKLLELVGI